jgi:hypothetical protein
MNVKNTMALGRRWTAAELRKRPHAQRDASWRLPLPLPRKTTGMILN